MALTSPGGLPYYMSMARAQEQQAQHPPRRLRLLRFFIDAVLVLVWLGCILFAALEERSSELQAKYFSALDRLLTYSVAPGPSPAVTYPHAGPSDKRRGYTGLAGYLRQACTRGYGIEAQARMSPQLLQLCGFGLYPPYHEKPQAGLEIYDCRGNTLFDMTYPARIYENFEAIPPVIVQSLLFIENRELLDPRYPRKNPAVDWVRLGRALAERAANKIRGNGRGPGGSTLATQIEKYRHSPAGYTASPRDKVVQMLSASLRAYLDGEVTLEAQMGIILHYINSIPLGAYPGYGEIIGIGDGLWAWYGADFESANRVLARRPRSADDPHLVAWSRCYKQLLSLFIAQRRPAYYLLKRLDRLEKHTLSYLEVLAARGIITPFERDAAAGAPLAIRRTMPVQYEGSFLERKPANAVRTRLLWLLGVPQLYCLDRLDLTVSATLDSRVQEDITWALHRLKQPAPARTAGLYGRQLLAEGDDPSKIIYSLTLYESTGQANLLRIMTDTNDQPLNINEGIKLELGSTAKLRTLVTYLEIMAELHGHLAGRTFEDLDSLDTAVFDPLSKWAVEYLAAAPDRSLPAMLEAAMERRYSASPDETFFTGGGPHTFANFSSADDNETLSLRAALRRSVNLVFIRLMRDIVAYYTFVRHESSSGPLDDRSDPARRKYLARFADAEGQQYLCRFYAKYRNKTPGQALKIIVSGIEPSPVRLAVIYRSIFPEATLADFTAFLKRNLPASELSGRTMSSLYKKYSRDAYSLADRGFLAHVHPLELWTVAYLRAHTGATQAEAVRDSRRERQEVYRWLFTTRDKAAQDSRIQIMVETEAFQEIHRMWQRLGYPFDSLVPSYATAIGSSADRPAALAELVGILNNNGVYAPARRISRLHFAAGTPYETVLAPHKEKAEQVMSPEVARFARQELRGVVEYGTAHRICGAFAGPGGMPLAVGGKTGTGDNRYNVYNAEGDLVRSSAINRTATFVFFIGERFFGTLTAYVPGPAAAGYSFTSSLPLQVLKSLAPRLMPLINGTVPDIRRAARAAKAD